MRKAFLSLALVAALVAAAGAQSYKVALKDLPTSQYYKDLMAAIAEVSGAKFDVQVVPGPRAVYLISNGQTDMEIPELVPIDQAQLKAQNFDYGSVVFVKSAFVLFTNKAKGLDIASMKAGNSKGYAIESDGALAKQFGFVAQVATNFQASLLKLNEGKIDGFLHSQTTSDPIAKGMTLSNVKRQLYEYYDLSFALPKGQKGNALDVLVADAVKKLKASGKYEQILGKYIAATKYNDWQP
jgi:ABC-type amino acid transport substrate-binding protein